MEFIFIATYCFFNELHDILVRYFRQILTQVGSDLFGCGGTLPEPSLMQIVLTGPLASSHPSGSEIWEAPSHRLNIVSLSISLLPLSSTPTARSASVQLAWLAEVKEANSRSALSR